MTDTPKQQLIAARGFDINDSQLVGAVHCEEIDFAARAARDTGVNHPQIVLERAWALLQGGSQLVPGERLTRPEQDHASPGHRPDWGFFRRPITDDFAGTRLRLGHEEMGDVLQPASEGFGGSTHARGTRRYLDLLLIRVPRFRIGCHKTPYSERLSSRTKTELCPPYGAGSTSAFSGSCCH
jgi:hypothetical protein